jgi:hypothetical protein
MFSRNFSEGIKFIFQIYQIYIKVISNLEKNWPHKCGIAKQGASQEAPYLIFKADNPALDADGRVEAFLTLNMYCF